MGNKQRPYYDANDKPIMERSAVAVADILGYTDRMRTANDNNTEQEELEWLSERLEKAHEIVADPSKSKWSMKVYSDNLIIGYPSLVGGSIQFEFTMACWHMVHLQLQLARDGLLMRGGIAVGNIHIGDTLVFGHILEELSTAEKLAEYPRTILLKSAQEYVDAHPDLTTSGLYANSVHVDEDAVRYINYMYPICSRPDFKHKAILTNLKAYIDTNLNKFREDPKTLKKYRWAAKYHNQSCERSRFYNDPAFIIPL